MEQLCAKVPTRGELVLFHWPLPLLASLARVLLAEALGKPSVFSETTGLARRAREQREALQQLQQAGLGRLDHTRYLPLGRLRALSCVFRQAVAHSWTERASRKHVRDDDGGAWGCSDQNAACGCITSCHPCALHALPFNHPTVSVPLVEGPAGRGGGPVTAPVAKQERGRGCPGAWKTSPQ